MIRTQQIKSTTDVPINIKDYHTINVLKWKDSAWKTLCPYYMRTDGEEWNYNAGGILFENFWQGSKVYRTIVSNEVYPSKYQQGNPKYLWWQYKTNDPSGDRLINDNNELDLDTYLKWRNSLWNCQQPIRYPNKIQNRKDCRYALIIDKDKNHTQLDYITFRKEVYCKEYSRLVRTIPEYQVLLNMLKKGENLMICEVDVPAKGKKGPFGSLANDQNISVILSLECLETLMNNPNEAYGHGLVLAHCLLQDVNK